MKNKLFSRGLYVEGLRQLKIVGIIFLAVLLLVGISIPVIQYVNFLARQEIIDNPYMEMTATVIDFEKMCAMVFFIALVAAPVFTFMLFSPFNKRSASDFYHSLPYTRGCMFTSFSAAVLSWLGILTVVYCSMSILTCALMPKLFIINLSGMGDALLTILAYSLMLVFGIIAAMSLTGTPLANITCTVLLLFLPRLLITLVTIAMGELAPIISGHFGIFGTEYNALVNLVYNLFWEGDLDTLTGNIASDIYSIFVAILYIVLAAYLFCHRKSETSGHSAPGKTMHHIIRICVGLVISSIVTCAVISGFEIEIAIVFYIVSIIIYFAYELITQKTFRTIPSTLPGLAILVGLNIAILATCFGCAAYVHSYEPDSEDVAAIYIEHPASDRRSQISFGEYALKKAGELKIEERNAIAIATDALKVNNERSKNGKFYSYMYDYDVYDPEAEYVKSTELHIVYVSKLGIKRTRNIYIPIDDYAKIIDHVQTNEAYKNVFFDIPDAVNRSAELFEYYKHNYIHLSDNDLNEIFESIRSEVKTLDFATWAAYLASGSTSGGFRFYYVPVNEDVTINFYFDKTILPKTTALVIEKTNTVNAEIMNDIYEIFSDFEAATDKYDSIYINMSSVGIDPAWELYYHYYSDVSSKNTAVSDEFVRDLKALAEGAKSGKLEKDKFIIAYIEYSDYDDDNGNGVDYNGTVFLPYPEGFVPESDNFNIVYTEEYYKYYEDAEIYY